MVGGFEEQLQEINVDHICAYFCQNFILSFFGLYTVFQNLLALACFSLPKWWPFISCTELKRVICKFGRCWQPRR